MTRYLPNRGECCTCGTRARYRGEPMEFRMVGFAGTGVKYVFCRNCFIKWMGYSNMRDQKCPRRSIFKVLAGKMKCPFPH